MQNEASRHFELSLLVNNQEVPSILFAPKTESFRSPGGKKGKGRHRQKYRPKLVMQCRIPECRTFYVALREIQLGTESISSVTFSFLSPK